MALLICLFGERAVIPLAQSGLLVAAWTGLCSVCSRLWKPFALVSSGMCFERDWPVVALLPLVPQAGLELTVPGALTKPRDQTGSQQFC